MAQTCAWFRVAASQPVYIVGATADTVTWTNHPAGGTATVHCTFWTDGYWNSRVPLASVETSGSTVRARLSLDATALQAITCSHNLNLIARAKARFFVDNPFAFTVSLADLYPAYLGEIPICPAGGMYMLGAMFMDPLCSFGGAHSL